MPDTTFTVTRPLLDSQIAELDKALALHVPEHLREGLRRYIVDGIPTGSFLAACLSNDLLDAVCRANDNMTLLALPRLMKFLYNDTPQDCWGTRLKVKAWSDAGGWKGRSR